MTALSFEAVTKGFGSKIAVDDLSFAVPQGQVFGFLGGNGAGKTTSLRMVLDIIRPDSGRIGVLGRAPGRENTSDLGFLPEERGLYRSMTALDTIIYFGRLKGMSAGDARLSAKRLLERFGLGASLRTNVDKLSKGMAQKVQLAAAIVNEPKLVILDEPFSGLDPVNQGLLEGEIIRLAHTGATVIFSTHVMQHAERLCDRLMLIAQGAKVFEGTQDEARARLPGRLRIAARSNPADWAGVAAAELAGSAGPGAQAGRSEWPEGPEGPEGPEWPEWNVQLLPGVDAADVLQACTENGIGLRRFDQQRPSLHDVFIHLVGGEEQRA